MTFYSLNKMTKTKASAKAQQVAKAAKTPVEMVNTQEAVDALHDRIQRQLILDKEIVTDECEKGASSTALHVTAEDQAVIDRIVKAAGMKGMKTTKAQEQLEAD